MSAPAVTRDIFIVCNNIDEVGGVQRVSHQLAALFSARGHRVRLIGVVPVAERHDHGDDLPYATEVLHEQHPPGRWRPRFPWQRLNVRAATRELGRARDVASAAGRLSAMFAAARPGGVVIVPQVWAMEWVAQSDTHGMPVIGMSHESFAASRASSRHARVHRYFADVHRLLLLTREDADAWAVDGLSNVGVMPNPLPFTPASAAMLEAPVVTSLGRFSPEKGYDLLLEAWALLPPDVADWRLRLYGSGPEEPALRAMAADLGISGTVEFAGATAKVEEALLESSIFALSSRAEGFPMSILEAMACGVPSVAFDCAPGVREIVTDAEDGLVVAPGNTDRFAEALAELMRDADLRRRLGARAAETVRRFSPEVILERWERMFRLVYR